MSKHGSRELDEDAVKLEAMGGDAGITLAECGPAPSKCEHKWDGPYRAFEDGNGGEATCSKCGRGAFNMWEVWE